MGKRTNQNPMKKEGRQIYLEGSAVKRGGNIYRLAIYAS